MPLPDDDVRKMIQYLLGSLPEKEAERLDELSITDDDFAIRLNVAENDLVDAYVRGELSSETRKRFQEFYLSSPKRREKVRFAETLLAYQRKTAAVKQSALVESRADASPARLATGRRRRSFQLIPQWGFVLTALVLLIAAASLLVENRKLRMNMAQIEAERAKLAQLEQELNRQLQQQQHSTEVGTIVESSTSKSAGAASNDVQRRPPAAIASFVLAPATRGVDAISTIAVPRGTKEVRIKLELEVNDFSRYRVTLKDPAAGREIWHSTALIAESQDENKAVSMILSVQNLKQQNYIFELYGITGGPQELITSYPFRFVVK